MADQGTEGLLSPFLRTQRFNAARPFLKGKVLDYGCGSGGLAEFIAADNYLGIEIDPISLHNAKLAFPKHRFLPEFPTNKERFDTIVSLAVIEHVHDPKEFLSLLAAYLNDGSASQIIVTTPHPAVDWIHTLGAKIGLFSKHASEEHECLLDAQKLQNYGNGAGLRMFVYKRFLFFSNQLAIFQRGLHGY